MSATVLQFPARVQRQAKRRISRVELEARHSWMMVNAKNWETQATDGVQYETDARVAWLKDVLRKQMGCERPTMQKMRRDIAEGRKLIEKRNRVKRWLASMGVPVSDVKGAEQALFAAFDKLHGCTPTRYNP